MLKVTVVRSKWLHGEYGRGTLLRETDGKMCCLGFAALAAGMDPEVITERGDFADVMSNYMLSGGLPFTLRYMVNDGEEYHGAIRSSSLAGKLITFNDSEGMDDAEREGKIRALGLRAEIEFTFVDVDPDEEMTCSK